LPSLQVPPTSVCEKIKKPGPTSPFLISGCSSLGRFGEALSQFSSLGKGIVLFLRIDEATGAQGGFHREKADGSGGIPPARPYPRAVPRRSSLCIGTRAIRAARLFCRAWAIANDHTILDQAMRHSAFAKPCLPSDQDDLGNSHKRRVVLSRKTPAETPVSSDNVMAYPGRRHPIQKSAPPSAERVAEKWAHR